MLVRCLDYTGSLIAEESLVPEVRNLIESIKEMILPIFPGAWKELSRDVSSIMLNELFNIALNRKSKWDSEVEVKGGFIDFAKQDNGHFIAIEVELGASPRLDSDILKLCLIKESTPNSTPILIVPSSNIKKRCHTGLDGDGVIRRIQQLKPVLQYVENIIVIEFDIPNVENNESSEHISDFSKYCPEEKGQFIRGGGGNKASRRMLIIDNPELFFLSNPSTYGDYCNNCTNYTEDFIWCDYCRELCYCGRCWEQKKVGRYLEEKELFCCEQNCFYVGQDSQLGQNES